MSKNIKHNLDSQVCNKICEEVDWVLPNHDAWTIHPNQTEKVRDTYISFMHKIWSNRRDILYDYFKSIGITKMYEDQFNEKLLPDVYKHRHKFSPYCLK